MEQIHVINVNGQSYNVTFDKEKGIGQAASIPQTAGASGPEFTVQAKSKEEAIEKLEAAIRAGK